MSTALIFIPVTLIIKFTALIFISSSLLAHIDHDLYHTDHHIDLIDCNIYCDMSCGQDAREPCSGPACRGAWQLGEAREELGQKQVDNIWKVELQIPKSHHKNAQLPNFISRSLIHLRFEKIRTRTKMNKCQSCPFGDIISQETFFSRNMMSAVGGVSKRFWLQCVFTAVLQYQNGRIKMLFPTRVEADPDRMVMISRDAAFTENPMERLATNFLYYKICYYQ